MNNGGHELAFQSWLEDCVFNARRELKLSDRAIAWSLAWVLQCILLKQLAEIKE